MEAEISLDGVDREDVRALALRLKAAVEGAGGSKQVADRAGVPLRTLNSYVAGAADPKVTKLQRIAEACGVSVEQLLGRKLPSVPAENGILVGSLGDDIVFVPRLDVRASAGRGRSNVDYGVERIPLSLPWLQMIGVSSPRNVEMLWAEGDSMEDTIKHGDMLLLDRGIDGLVNGCIYVFVVSELVVVKRLQLLFDGSLVLSSDNPKYKAETITPDRKHELTIEGRVKWYGRSL